MALSKTGEEVLGELLDASLDLSDEIFSLVIDDMLANPNASPASLIDAVYLESFVGRLTGVAKVFQYAGYAANFTDMLRSINHARDESGSIGMYRQFLVEVFNLVGSVAAGVSGAVVGSSFGAIGGPFGAAVGVILGGAISSITYSVFEDEIKEGLEQFAAEVFIPRMFAANPEATARFFMDTKVGGTEYDDTLFAGPTPVTMFGRDGDDSLVSNLHNDTVYGGAGDDTVRGMEGNDSLKGESGEDFLYGGDGHDSLFGDQNDDYLSGQAGADSLLGGSGNDRLFGDGENDTLVGESGDDELDGGDGTDTAVFEHNWQYYRVMSGRSLQDFRIKLSTHEGGMDRVANVERLEFANRTFDSISDFFQQHDDYWTVTPEPVVEEQPTIERVTPIPTPTGETPRLYVTDSSVTEGDSGSRTIRFEVNLSQASSQPVSFIWAAVGGNTSVMASTNSDFKFASGTYVFNPGEVTAFVPVTIHSDTKVEGNEYFNFLVSNLIGAELAGGGQIKAAKGWIIDDDARVAPPPPPPPLEEEKGSVYLRLEAGDPSEVEGPDGATVEYDFYVYRTGDLYQRTEYHLEIDGYGATPASADDFVINRFPDDHGTFQEGDDRERWTVTVRGDNLQEAHEYFRVRLSTDEPNAYVTDRYAYSAILNDDGTTLPTPAGEVYLSIRPLQSEVTEGGEIQFEITRSGDLNQVTGFRFYGSRGDQETVAQPWNLSGRDWQSASASGHQFELGESRIIITRDIYEDTLNEPDEWLTAGISALSDYPNTVILEKETQVLIRDDDGPNPAQITAPAILVQETDGVQIAHIRVFLSQVMPVDVSMDYTVQFDDGRPASSATEGVDFVAESGVFTIRAGQLYGDLPVTIFGDNIAEIYEHFEVSLEDPANGYFSRSNTDEWTSGVVIVDDDGGDAFFPTLAQLKSRAIDLGSLGIYDLKQQNFALDATADTLTYRIEVTQDMVIQNDSPRPDFIFDGNGTLLHIDAVSSFDYLDKSPITGLGDHLVFGPGEYFFHYSGNYTAVGSPQRTEFAGVPTESAVPLIKFNFSTNGSEDELFGEMNENHSGNYRYVNVELSHEVDHEVTVDIRVDHITTSSADFQGSLTKTLTFAPGDTSELFLIRALNDAEFEGREHYQVTIANAVGGVLPNGQATFTRLGTIVDDDQNPVPEFELQALSADRAEGSNGNSVFSFRVLRPETFNTATASVDWEVVGSGLNPASSSDFAGGVLPSGTVNFGVGESLKEINVLVAGDRFAESDEDFVIRLINPSTGFGLHTAEVTTTIRNDDGIVSGPVFGAGVVTTGVSYVMQSADEDVVVIGGAPADIIGNNAYNAISGNNAANRLSGGKGQDRLFGLDGNDTLDGGSNNDTVHGDAGADSLLGGSGGDVLDGGAQNDTIDAGVGDDTVYGGTGRDMVQLGIGHDRFFDDIQNDGEGRDTVFGGDGHDTIWGECGSDHFHGGNGNDSIRGGAGADQLRGDDGDDTLIGDGGDDYLIGGQGSDLLFVDSAGDRIGESRNWGGVDEVRASVDFWAKVAHIENLTLEGSDHIRGIGNGLSNVIIGNAGNNILDGGKNNDTLRGGEGNDIYFIRAPQDKAVEEFGQGIDTVKAYRSHKLAENIEHLHLKSTLDFNGIGNGLNNTIVGTNGNNILVGREGNDVLKGQAGDDTFVFDRAIGTGNVDRIIDFETIAGDNDTLKFKASALGGGVSAGVLDAADFATGTAAADASDRFVFDQASGQLWYDVDGTGAAAQVLLATFEQNANVEADDIVVF